MKINLKFKIHLKIRKIQHENTTNDVYVDELKESTLKKKSSLYSGNLLMRLQTNRIMSLTVGLVT